MITWKSVTEYAAQQGLEIYRPMCGHHRLVQIIDRKSGKHSWSSNKAKSVMASLQAMANQSNLATLSDRQVCAEAQAAKSFIFDN